MDSIYNNNSSDSITRSGSDDGNLIFNVQICGNSSVGKTSLIHRLIYDNYLENTVITLGVNYYKKNFHIQDRSISVLIHDTSGQERYMDITKQSVRRADALILVYDTTNEQSFQDIETHWISSLSSIVDFNNIPLILIGNKSDLRYGQAGNHNNPHQIVSYDQADQLARHYNMTFFEASALSGHQVHMAFDSLVQRLFLQRKQRDSNQISLQNRNYQKQMQQQLSPSYQSQVSLKKGNCC